jgi:imidazolonepropionase-like amidohydrolase
VVSTVAELGIRAAIGPSLADMWHDEHGVLTHQADPDELLPEVRAASALSDEDIALFAQPGMSVNYNPTGNAMLGSGITLGRSVPRLLAAGIPIALGSDYAPSIVSTRSSCCAPRCCSSATWPPATTL